MLPIASSLLLLPLGFKANHLFALLVGTQTILCEIFVHFLEILIEKHSLIIL